MSDLLYQSSKNYPDGTRCKKVIRDFSFTVIMLLIGPRIILNRIKWCYDTEGENSKFCTTGFPMGCYVTPQGVPKDACIISEKYRTASTFYLFNHVDITIYYHSGKGKKNYICSLGILSFLF